MKTEGLRVKFEPIEGPSHAVRVPFHVTYGSEIVTGWMRLRAGDPVPLVFERPPSPLSEIAVWASVILSFADLTVWPEEVVTSRRSPVPRPSQAARPEGVPAGARDHGFRASEDDTRRVSGVSLGECCRRISLSLIADGFPTDLRRVRKRLKRRRRSGFDSLRAKHGSPVMSAGPEAAGAEGAPSPGTRPANSEPFCVSRKQAPVRQFLSSRLSNAAWMRSSELRRLDRGRGRAGAHAKSTESRLLDATIS